MKFSTKLFRLAAIIAVIGFTALSLTGCSDSSTDSGGEETAVTTGVKLNKTALTLAAGQSETLKVTGASSNKTVSWNSSNATVATVTNGTVTAVTNGKAEIVVTTSDCCSAVCIVTVTDNCACCADPDNCDMDVILALN